MFLVYVEADVERCNQLTFHIGDHATTVTQVNTRGLAALTTNQWDITVFGFLIIVLKL